MTRDEAAAILDLPRQQAIDAILGLAGKAEKFDQLHGLAPTCPSGMTPPYLKKPAKKRCKKPGRKKRHPGVGRSRPEKVDHCQNLTLDSCPLCEGPLGKPVKDYKRAVLRSLLTELAKVDKANKSSDWKMFGKQLGRLVMDAERQMRTPVKTCKTPQQNCSHRGAHAHAILMSLFSSAELQGLNPVEKALGDRKAILSSTEKKNIAFKKAARIFRELNCHKNFSFRESRSSLRNSAFTHPPSSPC